MIIIPYNTDAPLYYPPIATVATIVLNVLLFVPVFLHEDPYATDMEGIDAESVEDPELTEEDIPRVDENGQPINEAQRQALLQQLKLLQAQNKEQRGKGLLGGTTIWRLMTLEYGKFRPWQWLTANYMHGDIFHLLGNMFVLWGFGLVVEGKVGWWRFLAIYNAIGVLGCGLIQLLMIFADDGFALGASLAIFGILVTALVWAPANEMQCFFMFGFRVILFEASIMTIAIGSVFLQLALSALSIWLMTDMGMGLRITGEIAHLIGGGLGLAVGVVMVKKNWVDCENWDMFSVWAGKNIKTFQEDREDVSEELEKIKQKERKQIESREAPAFTRAVPVNQQDALLAQFRSFVAAGKPVEAWNVFCRGERECPGWHVPEPDFVGYVSALRKQQLWEHAAGAMNEYLQRYTERETTVRLALTQVLVQQLNRPRDAWQVLSLINEGLLSPQDKGVYDKLRTACKQRIAAAKNKGTQRPNTSS